MNKELTISSIKDLWERYQKRVKKMRDSDESFRNYARLLSALHNAECEILDIQMGDSEKFNGLRPEDKKYLLMNSINDQLDDILKKIGIIKKHFMSDEPLTATETQFLLSHKIDIHDFSCFYVIDASPDVTNKKGEKSDGVI